MDYKNLLVATRDGVALVSVECPARFPGQ